MELRFAPAKQGQVTNLSYNLGPSNKGLSLIVKAKLLPTFSLLSPLNRSSSPPDKPSQSQHKLAVFPSSIQHPASSF